MSLQNVLVEEKDTEMVLARVVFHGLQIVLVVEPDYLPDSEVLAFSRVYTP
jgi:hypothetical protein